ncbi:AAA family ATPase [Streptosporangium subroseum]|uniref:AAA family ATPase n=1 Tax=Streptosporangium subroseum TaxID=106412 RepID=UPI0034253F79
MANHRSLREEAELSLVATEFNEGTARLTGVKSEGREIGLVPLIGIFGPNASGKSNILAAIRAMRSAVRGSVLEWAQESGVPREPFAIDPQARDETTLFEVDLVLGRNPIRYTYGFELSDERVEAEWLHAYPHGRKQVWFDREADRAPEEGGEFRFPGDGLKGGKEQLTEITRANALFLTAAATFNHPQLSAVYRWFLDNFQLVTSGDDIAERSDYTRRLLTGKNSDPRLRERITTLLRAADLGITGMLIDARPRKEENLERGYLHGRYGGIPRVTPGEVAHVLAGTE